jgi:type I restriction enzyme S subunit
MSKIDELMDEFCPDGVGFRSIGEIADCISGATPASGMVDYWKEGTIPWLSSGEVNKGTVYDTDKMITQAGYDSCSTKMVPPGAVVIALAGQGKTRGLVARTRISLCTNQSLCAVITKESMNSDFLYYFLKTQYQQLRSASSGDGGRGGLNLQIIRGFRVPVPSLEVQREVVRVLDTFTELEEELEAELEARRQQQDFYRNSLLSVDESDEVIWTKLGDAFEMKAGYNIHANQISDVQDADHPFACFGGNGIRGFVKNYSHEGSHLMIGRQGALCGNVKRVVGKFYATEHAVVLTASPDVDHAWAFHMLDFMNLNQYATRSAQPGLAVGNIGRIRLPLPSLVEQHRVAVILDKFDTLVNDLSIGLPAELNARRQQYECYRDKLLTFEEFAV